MTSITMTASFITSSTMATKQAIASQRRAIVVAKASRGNERERVNLEVKNKEESSNGRRDLLLAAVGVAAYSIANVAVADEPKAGTLEAKKKYGPVCVTMPTARICHK